MEEGAMALLELTGAGEVARPDPPQTMADLRRFGADCRRRGKELVIQRSGDFRFQRMLEIDRGVMDGFRSRARAVASGPTFDGSAVMRFDKLRGRDGVEIRFASRIELVEMLSVAMEEAPVSLGLPLSWTPGIPGLHPPGCVHQR